MTEHNQNLPLTDQTREKERERDREYVFHRPRQYGRAYLYRRAYKRGILQHRLWKGGHHQSRRKRMKCGRRSCRRSCQWPKPARLVGQPWIFGAKLKNRKWKGKKKPSPRQRREDKVGVENVKCNMSYLKGCTENERSKIKIFNYNLNNVI